MTAKELILELSKVPEETIIEFQIADGCCNDYEQLNLLFADADTYVYTNETIHTIQIRFEALTGFESCIKAGRTKEFIKTLYKKD